MPETRLLTLEQLDTVFGKKSSAKFATFATQSLMYQYHLRKDEPDSFYGSDGEEEVDMPAFTRRSTTYSEDRATGEHLNQPNSDLIEMETAHEHSPQRRNSSERTITEEERYYGR